MKKIGISLALLFFLILFNKPTYGAACSLPASGNYTVSSSCDIAATDKINGLDGCNNDELSTTNTAVLTVGADVAITTLAGSTIVTGSLVLEEGAVINLGTGTQIKIGTPLYMQDDDTDGYLTSLTDFYTSTASGRRRRCLAKSLTTVDCNSSSFSSNNSCFGHNNIAITNSGTTLTNYDVLFSLDTATPITAASMTSDCGDIRIKDSDNTTSLSYWIESGCNTTDTQIWVRVPSIPNGSKTIYIDYDGITTTNGQLAWTGSLTLLRNSACPSGTTRNTTYDNFFIRGSNVAGTTGGTSSTHTHEQVTATSGNANTTSAVDRSRTPGGGSSRDHSHTGVTVNVSANSNTTLPPYLDMVFCSIDNNQVSIPTGMIALFNSAGILNGWTRFTPLDTYFPRGGSSYTGTPTGASSHTHPTVGGFTTSTDAGLNINYGKTNVSSIAYAQSHTSNSGVTGGGSNIPSYVNMIFASSNETIIPPPTMIGIFDSLPPLGWSRFALLDNAFPRGSSTYQGSVISSDTHQHSVSITTSAANSPRSVKTGTSLAAGGGHTHTAIGITDYQTSLPPYKTVIYAQRNSPQTTVSVN